MTTLQLPQRAAACLVALCAAWPLAAGAASTQPNGAEASELAAVRERFAQSSPSTKVDSVAATPIPGLYEVVMGRNIAYVDATGKFALLGSLIRIHDGRDLTSDRKSEIDKIDVRRLPTALALRHVKGDGKRVLYVFADPQCGYCKALEQTLQSVDGVTIYTFMVPILGPASQRLAEAVACSADPAAAWTAWMVKGQPPAGTTCDKGSTEAVLKLATELGVNATPTLIAADGRLSSGAKDLASLQAWLSPPALAARQASGRPD
ncbi:MAG: DsbC family protein [Rubrivivax sp.]